jgi:hypothetical protein
MGGVLRPISHGFLTTAIELAARDGQEKPCAC